MVLFITLHNNAQYIPQKHVIPEKHVFAECETVIVLFRDSLSLQTLSILYYIHYTINKIG